jgi:hypothetical protein
MSPKSHHKAQLAVTVTELQIALDGGWVIDAPVTRQQIPDQPDGAWYCHVILWRAGRVQLLTVPDDPALRRLLAERGADIA